MQTIFWPFEKFELGTNWLRLIKKEVIFFSKIINNLMRYTVPYFLFSFYHRFSKMLTHAFIYSLYLMGMTLYFSWIFILHSNFLNQGKFHLQIKQKMLHNCYHLKMSCKLIYTKNNLISFHFLNLSLLLVSQYSRHFCANSSPEHLANLMPDGPADAEQNRE